MPKSKQADLSKCAFFIHSSKHIIAFGAHLISRSRSSAMGGPRYPHRAALLGKIGEEMARVLLSSAGFNNVCNLNERKANHPDADFLAERDRRYFVSVKARNMMERSGRLNVRYKLESSRRKIADAKQEASAIGAEFAWLAIQIGEHNYSAYFGTHEQLCSTPVAGTKSGRLLNGRAIMMRPVYTSNYLALAIDEPHELPYELIMNMG